jgi:hypothetical protein
MNVSKCFLRKQWTGFANPSLESDMKHSSPCMSSQERLVGRGVAALQYSLLLLLTDCEQRT